MLGCPTRTQLLQFKLLLCTKVKPWSGSIVMLNLPDRHDDMIDYQDPYEEFKVNCLLLSKASPLDRPAGHLIVCVGILENSWQLHQTVVTNESNIDVHCQPNKDPLLQPCITALDNWWSLEEIYNTSSCPYWQSSCLFLFKLCFHWHVLPTPRFWFKEFHIFNFLCLHFYSL